MVCLFQPAMFDSHVDICSSCSGVCVFVFICKHRLPARNFYQQPVLLKTWKYIKSIAQAQANSNGHSKKCHYVKEVSYFTTNCWMHRFGFCLAWKHMKAWFLYTPKHIELPQSKDLQIAHAKGFVHRHWLWKMFFEDWSVLTGTSGNDCYVVIQNGHWHGELSH